MKFDIQNRFSVGNSIRLKNILKIIFFITFLIPGYSNAAPGQLSLTLDTTVAQAASQMPLTATQGLGFSGALDYRLTDFFAIGINSGLIEFIAPNNGQDMKTIWLDVDGRFFPFKPSDFGEAYLQLGFGVCPHFGLFPDYWPNYASQYNQPLFYNDPPGTIYWDAQAAVGYIFSLGKDLGLDTGIEYDYFWPPADTPLQTFAFKAGVVFSFDLDMPKKER